ncbi:hypothetical protein GGU10DRAFT_431218 [Lentinula aff. detonsa]|uniref:RING-type domain-containing protein n=1 Tax=Lentinula aff. detonsa TaxID=2804958 RepID=A0AA38NRZ3_9AGAR|nr:hypothetical protein GGU10DRAFT_431218 [Lentinula aff. detonsa]
MSSFVTRQATPGPSTVDNLSINSRKRSSLDDASDTESHSAKKLRGDALSTKTDKKKRKRKRRKIPVVTSIDSISKSEPPIAVVSRSVPIMGVNESSDRIQETIQPLLDLTTPTAINSRAKETTATAVHGTNINEVERLNAEIATKSALICRHESAMSQIQQNITCQICLDLLYKPYALAPCGHIACYSCLMSWFSRPTEEGADQPPIYLRKKSCPHCRTTVRDTPVEVWAIKNMVNSLGSTGLLVGLPLSPEPVAGSSSGIQTGSVIEPLKKELWKDIFYPHRSSFLSLASREDAGIRDDEDGGVYRCVDCMHEIADGACTHCHRIYRAHGDFEFGDDLEDDDDAPFFDLAFHNHLDDADYDQEDNDYIQDAILDFAYNFPPGFRMPRLSRNRGHVEAAELDDGDDESDSMSGFIDDGEIREMEEEDLGSRNIGEVDRGLDYDDVAGANASEGPNEVVEVSDDEDERPTGPARRRVVNRAQTTINLLSDEENAGKDDADEEENEDYLSDEDSETNDEIYYQDDIYQDDIYPGDDDHPNSDSAYEDGHDDEYGYIYRL